MKADREKKPDPARLMMDAEADRRAKDGLQKIKNERAAREARNKEIERKLREREEAIKRKE